MSQALTVELTEREMSQVQAAAQAKDLDPKNMTVQQLVELLGAVNDAITTASDQELLVRLETPKPQLTTDEVRAKRLAVAMSVNGIWKGQADKPQDGLEYQREVRAEWQ